MCHDFLLEAKTCLCLTCTWHIYHVLTMAILMWLIIWHHLPMNHTIPSTITCYTDVNPYRIASKTPLWQMINTIQVTTFWLKIQINYTILMCLIQCLLVLQSNNPCESISFTVYENNYCLNHTEYMGLFCSCNFHLVHC